MKSWILHSLWTIILLLLSPRILGMCYPGGVGALWFHCLFFTTLLVFHKVKFQRSYLYRSQWNVELRIWLVELFFTALFEALSRTAGWLGGVCLINICFLWPTLSYLQDSQVLKLFLTNIIIKSAYCDILVVLEFYVKAIDNLQNIY